MILEAVTTSAPQVTPQVNELLAVIQGEMSREALQAALGLSDRKSFRERYLQPALADGLIAMTIRQAQQPPAKIPIDRQGPMAPGAYSLSPTH